MLDRFVQVVIGGLAEPVPELDGDFLRLLRGQGPRVNPARLRVRCDEMRGTALVEERFEQRKIDTDERGPC